MFPIYTYIVSTENEMKSATTRTTEYDDFAGRKEQLRIAPCRRCAKIGKEISLM